MKEVILIGSYQQNEALNKFIQETQKQLKILIRFVLRMLRIGAKFVFNFRHQCFSPQSCYSNAFDID